jgi:hypothetical protein
MLFAVFVGARNYCFLVPATSARKAKKVVWQYLNSADQIDTDAVTAIAARRLPAAKRNAPQKKHGVLIAWPKGRRLKKFYQQVKKEKR